MKKISSIIMIIMGIILFSGVIFADTTQDFNKTYKEIEVLTVNLFEKISAGFTGKATDSDKLIRVVDKILINSKILEKAESAVNNKACAAEASQMNFYMAKIKIVIITGAHKDKLTMLLSRYYLHFIQCNTLNIMSVKLMLNDHLGKLKEALAKNEITEIEYLSEHLCIYSDQMYYASYVFGKKIWQKFAKRVKKLADEIFKSAQKKDLDAVKEAAGKIEKPLSILNKLITK